MVVFSIQKIGELMVVNLNYLLSLDIVLILVVWKLIEVYRGFVQSF